MSLRLSQLQHLASMKDLGPQSAPMRGDPYSPKTNGRKRLSEQAGGQSSSNDGRKATTIRGVMDESCHKSVDGNLSISDIYDFNSSMNHKSSSTTFNFDPVKERDEIINDGANGMDSRYIKCIMITVLALLAATVAVLVCFSVRSMERGNFEAAFQQGAQQIGAAFKSNVGAHIQAIESLGIQTTSWASASTTNSSWPQVTVPDFDLRGLSARGMAHSLSVVLLPIVTEQSKFDYEEYTQNNQDWIFEGLDREAEISNRRRASRRQPKPVNPRELQASSGIEVSPVIYRLGEEGLEPDEGPGPFFPGWTMSPISPSAINFNFASMDNTVDEIQATLEMEQIIIGKSWEFAVSGGDTEEGDDSIQIMSDLLQDSLETDDAIGNTFLPIFDGTIDGSSNMVGMLTSTLSWSSVFETSVLSYATDHGLFTVLENDCDQQFTFLVNGQDVSLLGRGDLHDTTYDDFKSTFKLESLLGSGAEFLTPGSLLTLNTDFCNYRVNVYPSSDLEDVFMTNNRIWYSLAIALIFMITVSVFSCYDVVMEHRQQHVLQAAVEARMIVASLFPEQVRGRLFEQQRRVAGSVKSLLSSGLKKFSKLSPSSRLNSAQCSIEDPEAAPEKKDGSLDSGQRPGLVSQSTIRIKSYLSSSRLTTGMERDGRPIADLFPHTTVLFGDISGFTSWCSQRDPEQVFFLLESVYGLFDKIARKRGVFKVETIGDCYMAVTGLPDPQEDHSWRMAKFTLDCRTRLAELLKDLEVVLGPDTSELGMRFGMNSGPTTAGVLRGDKSRFQLFGDTVNTASRMESTGEPNRIQLSQATANSLTELGKDGWVRKRQDLVEAKGKGAVQTYWLASRPKDEEPNELLSMGDKRKLGFAMGGVGISTRMGFGDNLSDSDSTPDEDEFAEEDSLPTGRHSLGTPGQSMMHIGEMSTLFEENSAMLDDVVEEKIPTKEDMKIRQKTIMWQAELLMRNLRLIVARRVSDPVDVSGLKIEPTKGETVIDEVVEAIELPEFDALAIRGADDPSQVSLSRAVVAQVHDFVAAIAAMYPSRNAFHNFEHATHMAMSASKLLSRVVVPDCFDVAEATELHAATDGINSDPLTHFAVVFAALIHDVDHPGVPNSQLAKEQPRLAELYKHKSIAEQKSVDVAWDILMESKYLELRACIYSSESELRRFRQLVVNCVMATDIFDEDMKEFREKRWEKAFGDKSAEFIVGNRRATTVIEHITQVSDIAHTMQHWHVFRKFNERLFTERLDAFYEGRSDEEPSETWYDKELWFFDNYVIPLAKRLGDCEVFGIASNECLNYAMGNREEWAAKGEELVEEMLAAYTPPAPQRHPPKMNFHESTGSITFEPLKD